MKSDWLELLSTANCADKVPKGFLTAQQIGAEWELGRTRTCILIRRLIAAKKLECQQFKVQIDCGRVLSVPHYRKKK